MPLSSSRSFEHPQAESSGLLSVEGRLNRLETPASKPTDPCLSPDASMALAEAFQRWADLRPDRTACVFLADDGQKTATTYRELDLRARSIATRLLEIIEPGDRALLVYPAGIDFVAAFLGCQYAGVVAVPATHPKPRRPMPRMRRIAEGCGARVALTNRTTLDSIDFSQQDDVVGRLHWEPTDEVAEVYGAGDHWRSNPTGLAFLQFTSGSTSDPKGVMVSQANLSANLEAIRVAFGIEDEAESDRSRVGVFWLPAYHDMGLIGGVLTPLWVGGTTVLMSPASFLQNPLRWLQAIDEYGASISGAPNFAYDYCVRRIAAEDRAGLNLAGWRLAFSGAEPVRAETLRRFAEAFEPAGFNPTAFYPCYGLAEATLLAAGPRHDDNPTLLEVERQSVLAGMVRLADADRSQPTQELVGCGRAPAGHRVFIANPQSLVECGEREVGEILLAGPSVTRGYWGQAESIRDLWATPPGQSEPMLRTGDLGFIHSGELFVTGRLKDVIILRGSNHYPQDIEQTAEEAHPAVLPGAAFTVGEADAERLVFVAQIERGADPNEREAIARSIRSAISETHGLDASSVVLIRQAALPVTSSGKVQRSLCRDLYLGGELKVLHELSREIPAPKTVVACDTSMRTSKPRTAEEIEAWLGDWLSERLNLDTSELARDRPFADLGVDSLTAVELSGELEQAFGVPLPPVVAWNYPTPAALAGYLEEQSGKTGESPVEAAERLDSEPTPPIAAADGADAEVDSLLAEIESLSPEEAARLLGE